MMSAPAIVWACGALHRFYRCEDGDWLAIVCEQASEAAAVGPVLGLDMGELDVALAASRDGPLAQAVAAAFSGRRRAEVLGALLAAGVAAAPALHGPEALDSEWLWENGLFERWRHPRVGEVVSVRAYADFSESPAGFRHPTPDLAQHSAELLGEMGIAADRIEASLPPAPCSKRWNTSPGSRNRRAPETAASPWRRSSKVVKATPRIWDYSAEVA